jgi:hypothetical protein
MNDYTIFAMYFNGEKSAVGLMVSHPCRDIFLEGRATDGAPRPVSPL